MAGEVVGEEFDATATQSAPVPQPASLTLTHPVRRSPAVLRPRKSP